MEAQLSAMLEVATCPACTISNFFIKQSMKLRTKPENKRIEWRTSWKVANPQKIFCKRSIRLGHERKIIRTTPVSCSINDGGLRDRSPNLSQKCRFVLPSCTYEYFPPPQMTHHDSRHHIANICVTGTNFCKSVFGFCPCATEVFVPFGPAANNEASWASKGGIDSSWPLE